MKCESGLEKMKKGMYGEINVEDEMRRKDALGNTSSKMA